MQAYAFARPEIRTSFKVLKAKNDKYSWTYSPRPGSATLLDAAAQIMGPDIASRFEAKTWTSCATGEEGMAYVIDAVVVKGGGDQVMS